MAQQEEEVEIDPKEEHDEQDGSPKFQAPAPKSLDELVNTDKEDESLQKYKQALLGQAASAEIIIDKDNPLNVIVQKLGILVDGRPDLEIDLTRKDKSEKQITLKEGCQYKVKIYFYVQRDIVSGLKYNHKVFRKGIKMDKMSCMVGSYGPKEELQSYTSHVEDAPSGVLSRGTYTLKSQFTDDDKHDYLSWSWQLSIKKDWE